MKTPVELIEVEMNETKLVTLNEGRAVLTTGGVSTCICILMKGRIMEDTPFLLMHHWEGFDLSFDKSAPDANHQAKLVLNNLFIELAGAVWDEQKNHTSSDEDDESIHLDALYLIGGERASTSISGTEFEVDRLGEYAKELCEDYFDVSPATTYVRDHYRVNVANSMRIFFSSSRVTLLCEDTYNPANYMDYMSDGEDNQDENRSRFSP